MNSIKLNVFFLVVLAAQKLAESATAYLTNCITANSDSQQSLYQGLTQNYYLSPACQKYLSSSNTKLVTQSDNQIPVPVSSPGKTLLSPTFKVAVDTANIAHVTKATPIAYSKPENQPSYYYFVPKAVSPAAVTYASLPDTGNNYYENIPKKYHYGYRVSDAHSGAEFGHSEVNDGHSAKGYYHVLLPDGRLQNVKYWAGPSGYHATITYESKY